MQAPVRLSQPDVKRRLMKIGICLLNERASPYRLFSEPSMCKIPLNGKKVPEERQGPIFRDRYLYFGNTQGVAGDGKSAGGERGIHQSHDLFGAAGFEFEYADF